jgi:hypothetical protein
MRILEEFGYISHHSLLASLIRSDSAKALVVLAGLGAYMEVWIGLPVSSQVVLAILLAVELGVGIVAGIRRTGRFRGRKLESFGLKVLVYFMILLVFGTFRRQYEDTVPECYVYGVMHSFCVMYIIFVYLISILENTSYLLGGSKEIDGLLGVVRIRLKKVTRQASGGPVGDSARPCAECPTKEKEKKT